MILFLAVRRSIFISYAHSDGVELAYRLYDALVAAGHQAWLDRSQIAGGMEWGREIERAIERCDCEIALLSEASFLSDICRAEQLMCLDARKPIIPLLVQSNARRPVHLFAKQYYDFSDPAAFDTRFEELASLLAAPELQVLYSPPPEQSADPLHQFVLQTSLMPAAGRSEKLHQADRAAVERQIGLTATAVANHHGSIYKCTGEGSIAFFRTARACISCARELAAGFAQPGSPDDEGSLQLRIALHGGELQPVGAEYFGPALSRVNRICQVCYPGQVLLSSTLVQADVAPAGAALVDLGRHYLGDANEPEHLYQLVDEQFAVREFPPLPTLDHRPNNLVQQFSLFVGRSRELSELKNLLLGGHRLVTITAPGGYGKSRLAVQLCADLLPQFERGVFIVELAPITDPAQIVYQLASAIGFKFYGSRDPEEQIIDYLRAKQMLLCLDNFEHLVDGAPLVSRIIQAAPHIRIVVTSRELLNIAGEKQYELWPLPVAFEREVQGEVFWPEPVPAWDRTGGGSTSVELQTNSPVQLSDAARLFADRAVQRNASLAGKAASSPLIELICAKLSGIPLAIELAAAWMDGFTLPELHDELSHQLELEARTSDEPARHRSLRACLDWSWKLLGAAQQEMLMRLATFRGGFFSEAASAVLNIKGMALRTALVKLRDKSWLTTRVVDGHTRFYLRDMLAHEYVFAKLEESRESGGTGGAGDGANAAASVTAPQADAKVSRSQDSLYEQAVSAHAAYFAALVQREGPRLGGGGVPDGGAVQRQALRCWQLELENINEALDSAINQGEVSWLQPIATHLRTYLDNTSAFFLARERYSSLDAAARDLGDPVLQLQACLGLGRAQWRLGKLDEAAITLKKAQELVRQSGDRRGEATASSSMGLVHFLQGDIERATELQNKAIVICREIGDRRGEAIALISLGNVQRLKGDFASAAELYTLALAIFRAIGDRSGEANALNCMGIVHYTRGDYACAVELYSQALAIRREIGDRHGEANALNNLGFVHNLQSDHNRAMELFSQTLLTYREMGERGGEANALSSLGNAHYSQGDYARAAELYSQSLELRREIGERHGEAIALNSLGNAHRMQGDYARAVELYSQSLAICRELGGRQGEAYAFSNLGQVHYTQGDYARAAELHSQALVIYREIGERRGEASGLLSLGLVHCTQMDSPRAAELYSEALAIFCELKARDGIAVTCALAGGLLTALGRWGAAALALCGATARAADLGYKFEPDELQGINPGLDGIESAVAAGVISADQLTAWRAEGEALSLDELAEFTLDELQKLKDVLGKAT